MEILIGILLIQPAAIADVTAEVRSLNLPEGLTPVRSAILEWVEQTQVLDSRGMIAHLRGLGLGAAADTLVRNTRSEIGAKGSWEDSVQEAQAVWRNFYGLTCRESLHQEQMAATRWFADDASSAQSRAIILAGERERLLQDELEAVPLKPVRPRTPSTR